ncbi:hypothetical protein J4406_00610 [Candidatus Woesearchaeota archaeon]|nr:hypothetical protein [Candidatus Woesearchaeota archaeon]
MVFLGDLFYQFQGAGIYEYVLPFLLIFSILFAILEKTKIFNEKKNVNVIVSAIIALIFVTQFSLVYTLNQFLPKVSLFIVVAVMTLILFGIFGAPVGKGLGHIGMLIAAVISLFVIYWALSPSLGFELPYWIQYNWDVIIALVIIIIVIALIVGGSSGEGTGNKITLKDISEGLFGERK